MIEQLRVLFVDDEPNVLAAIRRMVHFKRPNWNLCFAENGQNALDIMHELPADVVVSDVMMPGMDGGTLLKLIRDQWPGTLRIALSGQVSVDQVMRSIRCVHQYVGKPSDGDLLIRKIELVMTCRNILLNTQMHEIVTQIDTLPVVPRIYQDIEAEFSKSAPSMERIANLIVNDMALAAKVISLINSPFFGIRGMVHSIIQAITLLGQDMIKALVLSSKLFMSYEGMGLPGISLQLLGEHSHRVATIARQLACNLGKTRDDSVFCFTAGMLHDVGKLVLAESFPDKFKRVIEMVRQEHCPPHVAEKEMIGATHAEIGAYLLALWGIESEVVQAVGMHHGHDSFDESIPMLLHVSNIMDHNCVRINENRAYRALNAGLVATESQRQQLKSWCANVEESWGKMAALAPLTCETFFGET